MGQRILVPVDLLTRERRELFERAAARNGKKLGTWLREVADAAARREPVPEPPSDVGLGFDPDPCLHRVFRVEVLAWGGRRCGGCGELL